MFNVFQTFYAEQIGIPQCSYEGTAFLNGVQNMQTLDPQ